MTDTDWRGEHHWQIKPAETRFGDGPKNTLTRRYLRAARTDGKIISDVVRDSGYSFSFVRKMLRFHKIKLEGMK